MQDFSMCAGEFVNIYEEQYAEWDEACPTFSGPSSGASQDVQKTDNDAIMTLCLVSLYMFFGTWFLHNIMLFWIL